MQSWRDAQEWLREYRGWGDRFSPLEKGDSESFMERFICPLFVEITVSGTVKSMGESGKDIPG